MYQKNHQLFSKLFGCLLIVIIILSCGPTTPGIWKDDKIAEGKRNTLHALNAEMLQYLKANRYKAFQFMLCKDLMDDNEMMVAVEKASIYMKQDTFSLLRDYYIVSKPDTKISINEGALGVNSFNLHYKNATEEMYVAFFVQQKLADKKMISAVYNKYDYGWKLSWMQISQYTLAGKTAPELYKLSSAQLNKGYVVDAVNSMTLATQCIEPSIGWDYRNADEMAKFDSGIKKAANEKYQFPFDIAQISTHPQIIRIFNQKTPEGLFPMVCYMSKIKLADTLAIKKENEQIKQVIGTLMPGINKDKKYVLYSAYNEKPSTMYNVDHINMTDKLQ